MRSRGKAESGTVKTVPGWIKVLVLLHVFASIVWALPLPPEPAMAGTVAPKFSQWLLVWNARYLKSWDPLRAYVLGTGSWQYWDMFAPEPANVDWYATADVTFRDGSTRTVAYPRMSDLPIPLKYVKERYRKYFERAHDPLNPRLWPPFAQTMALWAYTDPNNPPVVVRLKQHSLEVAPPGQPQADRYTDLEYFAYAVDQRWLRREAGGL